MEVSKTGEVPFIRIIIPLVLGITAAYWNTPSILIFCVLKYFLVGLLALLTILTLSYKWFQLYKVKWAAGILIYLLIFLAAYTKTIHTSQKLDQQHFSKTPQDLLVVSINSEPRVSSNILRFEAKIHTAILNKSACKSVGKMLISMKLNEGNSKRYTYGTLLLIPSNYTSIEAPHNPCEFDYKQYLSNKAIYHQVFLEEDQIKILQRNRGAPLIVYSIESRQKIVDRFSRFVKDKDAVTVASTLILGYRADLSDEIIHAYSSTGTMHVLSVSGMHVGIIFVILAFVLKGMDRTKKLRILKALIIITIIFAYTILTGLSAAACRAALMISFLILGKALNRSHNSYNLLAISAVILLIYNPFFLLDVGFQLSYLAVLGLIHLYPKIYHLIYVKNWVCDKIWSYAALSIAAQIATFPLSLFYFHQFPLYFLISNLFIVLPVALIMYFGMVFIIVPIDLISKFSGWLLEHLIIFTNSIVFQIENLPGSTVAGIWLRTWEYLLIYILILFILLSLNYKAQRLLLIGMAILFFFASGISLEKVLMHRRSKVVFYSLRKNYAIGLFDGRKAHVLTDLSPNDKTFLFSVKPFIEENQITDMKLLPIGANLETNIMFVEENFIQFKKWKMFIWDEKIKRLSSPPISVNLVLVRNNSLPNVSALIETIKFKQLVIDGSNYDSNIQRWEEEAKKLNISYYVLKRNSSLTVNL